MGGAGAVLSAALARGASAQMADASNCRGDPVSAARGPAVADAAALLPAGLDGAALVLPVAGRQAVVVAQPCAVVDRTRSDRPRGKSERSEERRVGKECVSTDKPRRVPVH